MDFFEILKDASHRELVEFIVDLAQRRDDIAILVQSRFSRSDGKQELKNLTQEMKDIVLRHQDRYGFISYYDAGRFTRELSSFLGDIVQQLVCAGKCWLAFQLLCKATAKLDNLAIDDSDGGLRDLIDLICDCWQQVIPLLDDFQRNDAFKWFQQRIEKADIEVFMDQLFYSYIDFFDGKKYRKAQLKLLDKMMEEMGQSQGDGTSSDFSSMYKFERYAVARFQCMKNLGASKENLLAFILPLSHLKKLCWLAVGLHQELGDFKSAEKLLLDFIERNNSHAGLVQEARMLLQEVYAQLGDRDAQQKNLRMVLVENGYFEPELYQRYKELFSLQQWPQQRDDLIANIPSVSYRASIFIQEGLTDRLLQLVVDSQSSDPSIASLKRYAPHLSSHIDTLLPFFESSLEKEAERAASRPMYRELAGHLVYLSKLDGGQKLAHELKSRWTERYKRKSAFLDELGKIL